MTVSWSKKICEIEIVVLNNGSARKLRWELQPINGVESNDDVQQNPTPADEPQSESRMLQEIFNRY